MSDGRRTFTHPWRPAEPLTRTAPPAPESLHESEARAPPPWRLDGGGEGARAPARCRVCVERRKLVRYRAADGLAAGDHRLSGACPGTRESAHPRDAAATARARRRLPGDRDPGHRARVRLREPRRAPSRCRLPTGCCRRRRPLRVVALQGDLRLYLPIQEGRVTAVGYHAVGDGALALDPVGTQANAGVFTRLLRRLFGEDKGSIRFYLMGGSGGSETGGLDIGAPPGTDVYAPVERHRDRHLAANGRRGAARRSDRHPALRQPRPRGLAPEPRAGSSAERRLDRGAPLERRSALSSTSPRWRVRHSPSSRRIAAPTCTWKCGQPSASRCRKPR